MPRVKFPPWQCLTAGLGLIVLGVPPMAPDTEGVAASPVVREASPAHNIIPVIHRPATVATSLERMSSLPPQDSSESSKPDAVRTMTVIATAYCPCSECCGRWADNHTASGKPIWYNGGRFVAADTTVLPFFTKIRVPGYQGGRVVPVLDRGRGIRGRRIDVFLFSHEQAKRWGTRRVTITILP